MKEMIKAMWDIFMGREVKDEGPVHPRIKEQREKDLKALESVRAIQDYVHDAKDCKSCVIRAWCNEDFIHCPGDWNSPPTEAEINKINEATVESFKENGWIFIEDAGLPMCHGRYLVLTSQGRVKSTLYTYHFGIHGSFKYDNPHDSIVAYKFDDGERRDF